MSITLYRFSELLSGAKERARDEAQSVFGYPWADDALASLRAFAEWFDYRLSDYNVDFFNCSYSSAKFESAGDDELTADDVEGRLVALGSYNPETLRGDGQCELTGYCSDEDAIDGFRIAWHAGERDLEKLLQAGFRSWLKAAQADCEYRYSDEAMSEDGDANDYWYTSSGALSSGGGAG